MPYMSTQLVTVCGQGGSIYTAGVKGKMVGVDAGTGGEATVAQGFENALATGVKNVPGHESGKVPC